MDQAEIKKLLEIKSNISELKKQKSDQILILQEEIDNLSKVNQEITLLISSSSFTTAANIFPSDMDAETAAKQKPQYSENVKYTKKIFSENQEFLLVDSQFIKNKIYIRFPHPELTKISQERYIDEFVKPTLVQLKKIENALTPLVSKSFYDDKEYIDTITLENVENFESFEFIAEEMELWIFPKKS
jgi:hypothetical protein